MLRKIGFALILMSTLLASGIAFESFRSLNQLSELSLAEKAIGLTSSVSAAEAPAEAGHTAGHDAGHAERSAASQANLSSNMVPFISLDELFANLTQNEKNHTLALKMDVEFFDPEAKQEFKNKQGVVRSLVIQASREQRYEELSSLAGKLYYKELLIRRMNEYFQRPLVKDLHFASFFLQ